MSKDGLPERAALSSVCSWTVGCIPALPRDPWSSSSVLPVSTSPERQASSTAQGLLGTADGYALPPARHTRMLADTSSSGTARFLQDCSSGCHGGTPSISQFMSMASRLWKVASPLVDGPYMELLRDLLQQRKEGLHLSLHILLSPGVSHCLHLGFSRCTQEALWALTVTPHPYFAVSRFLQRP